MPVFCQLQFVIVIIYLMIFHQYPLFFPLKVQAGGNIKLLGVLYHRACSLCYNTVRTESNVHRTNIFRNIKGYLK